MHLLLPAWIIAIPGLSGERRSVRGHLISPCSPALSAGRVKNGELRPSARRLNPYFSKPHQTLEGICRERRTDGRTGGRTGGRAPSSERLLMSTDRQKRVPPPSILSAGCFGNKGKIDVRVSVPPRGGTRVHSSDTPVLQLTSWTS